MGSKLRFSLFLLLVAVVAAAEENPDAALSRLRSGNERSLQKTKGRRIEVSAAQHPIATVVGCSDSRVPPELVFDQGLGDLFVVRVAGQVLDAPALGSIEYAAEHLGAHLVIVLGHERCGAVKAAVDGGEAPPNIASLVSAIRPAVDEVANVRGDKLDAAVRANVRRVVRQVRASVPDVRVVGMYYDLDTGKAETIVESATANDAIIDVMTAAADWQLDNPSKHPPYDWTQAPFYIGLNAFAPLSRDPQKYLAAVRANGEVNEWRPGLRPFCADDHAIAQSYFHLYDVTKEKAIIQPSLLLFDQVRLYPFDESMEFENWEKTWRQFTWCDALFMSPPAYALAFRATGERRYLEFMNRMWWKVTDYLYDKNEHLYYRDSRFFGTKTFWSRGNGWVLAGLARVLQNIPADYPDRPRYVALFREMSAKVATLQGSDGYWRSDLLSPDKTPLPETSGTAFYVYALAWGVNEGLLDRAKYEPVIRRGWDALVKAVQPNGMLGFVQRIGDQPGATSAETTEIYGVGAFLLAGSEVHRLRERPGRMPGR